MIPHDCQSNTKHLDSTNSSVQAPCLAFHRLLVRQNQQCRMAVELTTRLEEQVILHSFQVCNRESQWLYG